MNTDEEILNKINDINDKMSEYSKNKAYIHELESTYDRIVKLLGQDTTDMDNLDKYKLLCELKKEVISVINRHMFFSEGTHLHAIISEVKEFIKADIFNTKNTNDKILKEISKEFKENNYDKY